MVPPPCVAVAKISFFFFSSLLFLSWCCLIFDGGSAECICYRLPPHLPALFARGSAQRRGGVHIFILFEREIGGHLIFYSFFPPWLSWKNGTYLTSGKPNSSCLSCRYSNLDKTCAISEQLSACIALHCQLSFTSITTCGDVEGAKF